MDNRTPNPLFGGLFELQPQSDGSRRLASHAHAPSTIPDPETGRPLKVASVDLSDRGVCPACTRFGAGGYISFESDLRLAFACTSCLQLVWIVGA